MQNDKINEALKAKEKYQSVVESAHDYIEHFDILETITNVGNDEVFTPRKTVTMMLDSLPKEVWSNPNYKWLNPATKNGVFEREIAIRLNDGLKDLIPNEEMRKKHILQKMIHAYGQTKFTSNVARRTLYYCSEANKKCDGIKDENDGHYVNGYAIGNGTWFKDKEGNIKTPTVDHWFEGTKGKRKCKFCGIAEDSKYVDPLQREQYAYEFIHYDASGLRYKIKNDFFKGVGNMKFDIIIGNPPYQLSFGIDGANSSNSGAIYHKFVEKALELNPKYFSMIIKSGWLTKTAQGISDSWVDNMISRHNYRLFHDFENARECFPSNNIVGGVCYFLYDRDYDGKCDYYYHDSKGEVRHRFDYLDSKKAGIVIRDPRDFPIIDKISKIEGDYYSKEDRNFSGLVSPKHFFDDGKFLTSNWKDYRDDKTDEYYIKYYVNINKERTYKWISDAQLPKNVDTKSLNKVFIPAANGSLTNVLGKPFYGEPNSVCSQTFLVIGYDKNKHNFTEKQCENIIKYISTKFFRYLVVIKKKTQNGPRGVYQFVPLVDFDEVWTDEKLYKKYNLSNEEIEYIEGQINPMYLNNNVDDEVGDDDE